MMRGWRGAAVVVAGLAALVAVVQLVAPRARDGAVATRVDRDGAPAHGVAVDAAMQERIRAVARAASREEMARALDGLRRSAAPDFADLVPQLAIFLVHAEGEREALAPGVIVDRLGISRQQIVRGVVPHLEGADPVLRRQLENLLGAAEEGEGGGVDFASYREVLAESGGDPPVALVRYLYRRSPADAFAVLAQTQGARPAGIATPDAAAAADVARVEAARRTIAASGGLGADARAQAASALDRLSRHRDWWVRGYAAAVLRGDHRLADVAGGTVRERLAGDPDPRVREEAAAPGLRPAD